MKTRLSKNQTVNIITLGCAKNLVDSEVMLRQLQAAGFNTLHEDAAEADVVIINTCGFINDAKEESVNTILHWAKARKSGDIDKLLVMGCLSQRYKDDLIKEIPEVDAFFGVNDVNAILQSLNATYREALLGERVITTPSHYAYLKISEGCDRNCSFCAIPGIRGKNISRTIESLVTETEFLAEKGVKELILIAQDLTYYGLDLYNKRMLPALLEELVKVSGIEWIRLHYAYPAGFPLELLDVMNKHSKICKYIDIPLQHINSNILKSMHRGIDEDGTRKLVQTIREKVPGIAIRSSFIVGYPGETAKDFAGLRDFIRASEFERLGVFTYSHEENTPASELEDNVRPAAKARRAEELMLIQQDISAARNKSFEGKSVQVIIDKMEDGKWIGRTQYDSPEVDNEVIITDNSGTLAPGCIVNVSVTSSDIYDLIAVYPENQ
ncbi:MAG: 30S ribosomal protein S12 methylthiotransferase RimO [Bacteroidetes bacterium HGW-Bacteroidetes-11]|nr:MAG: 30S ribosomal protein S12 methylthiotransferase RimO [Bacteroidetes bacterium HGW-Bacteroidetes-11]